MKYSKAKDNEGGRLGKEMREEEKKETPAGSKYAPRHRSEIPAEELEQIADAYLVKGISQGDVARMYRVKRTLVHNLVKEKKTNPEKLRVQKTKEKEEAETSKLVADVAADMLERSVPIDKAATVQKAIRRLHNVDVGIDTVRHVLKHDLGLRYHVVKKIPI